MDAFMLASRFRPRDRRRLRVSDPRESGRPIRPVGNPYHKDGHASSGSGAAITGEPPRLAPQVFSASPENKKHQMGMPTLALVVQVLLFRQHIAHRSGLEGGEFILIRANEMAWTSSCLDFPASTSFVFIKKMGANVFAAGGLKQMGERTLGFQKSGSSVAAPQDRSTRQRKPFVPFTAVEYPSCPSTITSAASEMALE